MKNVEMMTVQTKKTNNLCMRQIAQSVEAIVDHFVSRFVSEENPCEDLTGLYPMIMDAVEARLITKTLKRCGGNKIRAAHVLGIHRNTLSQKLMQFEERPVAAQVKKIVKTSGLRSTHRARSGKN